MRVRPALLLAPMLAALLFAALATRAPSKRKMNAHRLPVVSLPPPSRPATHQQRRAAAIASPAFSAAARPVGPPMTPEELESVWSTERHNAEWSQNAADWAWAILGKEDSALDAIDTVDCRETLCRIELVLPHNSAQLLRAHAELREEHFPFQLGRATHPDRIVVFFAADGLGELLFSDAGAFVQALPPPPDGPDSE